MEEREKVTEEMKAAEDAAASAADDDDKVEEFRSETESESKWRQMWESSMWK